MQAMRETWLERLRGEWRNRAIAVGAALLLEALVLALLLSMGIVGSPGKKAVTMTEVSFKEHEERPPVPPQPERQRAKERAKSPPTHRPPSPQPPTPQPPAQTPPAAAAPVIVPAPAPAAVAAPPPLIASAAPPVPAGPTRARAVIRGEAMGPADSGGGGSSDSARVGTAPNGEPMYAAAWYHEPTAGELSGYLSTASGPGWGLIACRTVPDFRVEDCVPLDEYPQGSNMNRAILAAAWQFRVRPPFKGGQALVGSWVRIKIIHDIKHVAER